MELTAMERLFCRFGEEQQSVSRQPIVLGDSDRCWYVAEGEVTLFAEARGEGRSGGKREPIVTVRQGRLLCGIGPWTADSLVCSIQGQMETRLYAMPLSALAELDEAEAELLRQGLEQWTDTIRQWLVIHEAGEHREWPCLPELSAAREEPAGMARLNELRLLLDEWQLAFRRGIAVYAAAVGRREIERLEQSEAMREHNMRQAFGSLAAIMDTGKRNRSAAAAAVGADGELQLACAAVARFLRCKLTWPLAGEQGDPETAIRQIAKSSHLRMRKLALEPGWWKRDNGPLIAFRGAERRPVALLPAGADRYELHDSSAAAASAVDEAVAAGLAAEAFMLYRPLPLHPVRLLDLVRFSSQSRVRRDLTVAVVLGVLGGVLNLALPFATGKLIDDVIPEAQRSQVLDMGLLLFAMAAAMLSFHITRSIAMLRMDGRIDSSLQAAVWDRILHLPVPFFRRFSSGDLAMRASEIHAIRKTVSIVAASSLFTGIFSVFQIILLFSYSAKLAWIAVLLASASVAVTTAIGYAGVKAGRAAYDGKMTGFLLQALNGIAKIRVAGAEARIFRHWAGLFGQFRTMTFRQRQLDNVAVTFQAVFPAVTTIVLYESLFAGGTALSTGQFLAFQTAFHAFVTSMTVLGAGFLTAAHTIPQYERAKPILQAVPEIEGARAHPGTLQGAVSIDRVSFKYKEDGPDILRDVSLRATPGQFIAIVGTSGSGKSTLLRLLLGFEQPVSGAVYYDEHDLAKLDVQEVRSQLGVVLQNGKLMADDLFNNIVGTANLSHEQAWEAARQVGIDEDIRKMPMGMFTIIDENASSISGGQRQRILIARALVCKPAILILDEATSALDNRTQAIVSQSLEKLAATKIVVAHRLSTIVGADRIYVLDQGRIAEEGTYAELLARNGVFAQIAQRQLV